MPCRRNGVGFCSLALCSFAYSPRSWESDDFGGCLGNQRGRRDHRAPAWDREARIIPGVAHPLLSWCIRILALTDTLCLVSAAHLQRREWVMNST